MQVAHMSGALGMPLAAQAFPKDHCLDNAPFNLRRSFEASQGPAVPEIGDDEMAGEMLRMLSGCEGKAAAGSGEMQPSSAVSWSELELNCQKLDEAHIRIESLDLSDIDENAEAHNIGVNVEVEETQNPPHTSSYGPTTSAAAFLAHGRNSASFSPGGSDLGRPSSGPLLPRDGSPCSDSRFSSHRASGSPSQARLSSLQGGSLTNSPSLSASSGIIRLHGSPGIQGKLPISHSASHSPCQDSYNRSSRLHHGTSSLSGMGDNIGLHGHSQVGEAGASGLGAVPSQASKGGSGVLSGRTYSGAWKCQSAGGSPAVGSPIKTRVHNSESPAVIDPRATFEAKAQMRDAKLAQEGEKLIREEWRREKETENEPAPIRYSSLVVPGAISRDQARRMGVRGYLHSVKNKCGELFTTSKKTKG